jgi:hypothetical protein
VVGIGRSIEVRLVAGCAVRRGVRKGSGVVAFGAIRYFVAPFEREKIVVGVGGSPVESADVVALDAIGRIAGILVVRLGRSNIIIEVAIDTFIAYPVEPEDCFRGVAIIAANDGVGAQQGEAVFLMQPGDLVHQPVFRGVATGTIHAYGLVVNIGVAGNTFGLGIFKNQCFVAALAIYPVVLSFQHKFCGVVAELEGV